MMKEDYNTSYPLGEGSFSFEHLNQYIQRTHWDQIDLAKLKKIHTLNKQWLQDHLQITLTDRDFFLIKEYGLSAGALLIKEIDWEIVAILSQDSSFNYFHEIVNLCAEVEFVGVLNQSEKEALKVLILLADCTNSSSFNHQYQLCLNNLQLKQKYS